ncbi:MAG: outer membrane biosynthesis protein TonB, partial [Saprospiraceae bacterium]
KYQLAAVTFIIDEKGQVQDPNMFLSTEDENIDKLLLETIRNMKNWQPAVYEDGTIIKQELVLTVGDMNSCAINMLNIELD